jgi:hypothetical protein
MVKRSGKPLNDRGRGTLLRAENACCSFYAAQDVIKIASHINLNFSNSRMTVRDIDLCKPQQLTTAISDLATRVIQKMDAESLSHSGTSIRRSRIAGPDYQTFSPTIESRFDKLSNSVRCRFERITRIARDEPQSRSRSYL